MAGLGFAREQLEKQGWKEGKGLGKEEDGIKEAIKVGIKNDTQGVGYKISDQFTFHWWDHVFNKAAKSIVVNEGEDGIEVSKTDSKYLPISTQRPSKHSEKPLLYGRFVKASTSSKAQSESDSDSEIEKDFSTDHAEDIVFKKCGGRTAHKGARHGLKLNGKLKRIEEHDKVAMSEPCSRSASPVTMAQEDVLQSASELQKILKSEKKELSRSYSDSEECVKKKKKKRERTYGGETSFDEDRHSAKSKKKKNRVAEEVRHCSDEFKTSTQDFGTRISREDARASEIVHSGTENAVKKKKKRCSSKLGKDDTTDFEQEIAKGEQQIRPGIKMVKKKKKKNKRRRDKEMNNDEEGTMEQNVKEQKRRKKEKKKEVIE